MMLTSIMQLRNHHFYTQIPLIPIGEFREFSFFENRCTSFAVHARNFCWENEL